MCGIVGVIGQNSQQEQEWLKAALKQLTHRGPDDEGIWWSPKYAVGFGHRRLSILDLSSASSQPMVDRESQCSITFNGEIYNYQEIRNELEQEGLVFRSNGDTEVLLKAYRFWGRSFIDRIKGMFSFAIMDSQQEKVILVRDRVGEKPLFYHQSAGILRFASELKALLCHPELPKQLNHSAFFQYLYLGYVSGSGCILTDYKKLPAAHALSYDLKTGNTEIWRYWSLPETSTSIETSPAELVEELEELLLRATKMQLHSDVPIGVLLSGGLDSSLVTAMAAHSRPSIKTFSVRFPGYKEFDETDHARLIANYFGTEHSELEAQSVNVDLLNTLAHQFDEPIADSSMVPCYLITEQIRKHCTVVLGGDGGDELFGGYRHYERMQRFHSKAHFLPKSLQKTLSLVAAHYMPLGSLGKNVRTWIMSLSDIATDSTPFTSGLFDKISLKNLIPSLHPSRFNLHFWQESAFQQTTDTLVNKLSKRDFFNYLPDDILVKVDRTSMANSIEVRSPLLDHNIVEFAFSSVPSTQKIHDGSRKILLQLLAKKILPTSFNTSRKQGFSIPLDSWLREPAWNSFFYDTLTSRDSIFNSTFVKKMLSAQLRGSVNGERLFALVMFELWRKNYQINI